ncbi:serpentine type 7TM GPCR chemoreceptor str domain-containing protein [Ditylenchus destructor]|uniref:Serpentine type 7TM GPCR chemoreceptor str domain-containing protein n=1 Tax=Ditylenchus destructor TaxID=166010 RepID=A0AAD4R317_9BILA|nr:serpentine type 7TM GPCR chemoreceptor str domain-containing protein [Ditylenchus destructor]
MNIISSAVGTSICTAGIALNILLFWLTCCHTPAGLKEYSRILQLSCILDFGYALMNLLCHPIAFLCSNYVVVICDGFLARISSDLSFVLYLIWCSFVYVHVLLPPIQFLCRHRLLCRKDASSLNSYLLKLSPFCSVLLAASIIVTYNGSKPTTEKQNIVKKSVAEKGFIDESGVEPFGFATSFRDISGITVGIFYCATFVLAYGIAIWCEYKIYCRLKSLNTSLSSTKKMQNQLKKALIANAITPVVSTGIPSLFFVMGAAFGLSVSGSTSAVISTFFTIDTLCNPILTIIYITQYKQAIYRKLSKINPFCKISHVSKVHSLTQVGSARGWAERNASFK